MDNSMKRCPVSLIIRHVTQNYREKSPHLSGWLLPKKSKCWWGRGATGTLVHYWWEQKMVQLLWKTEQMFLKKLKIKCHVIQQLPFWVFIWKNWNQDLQMIVAFPIFTAVVFPTATPCRQPKCPVMKEWMKKMWYILKSEHLLFSLKKKKEILQHTTTWMSSRTVSLEDMMLSEERQVLRDSTYMRSLK